MTPPSWPLLRSWGLGVAERRRRGAGREAPGVPRPSSGPWSFRGVSAPRDPMVSLSRGAVRAKGRPRSGPREGLCEAACDILSRQTADSRGVDPASFQTRAQNARVPRAKGHGVRPEGPAGRPSQGRLSTAVSQDPVCPAAEGTAQARRSDCEGARPHRRRAAALEAFSKHALPCGVHGFKDNCDQEIHKLQEGPSSKAAKSS